MLTRLFLILAMLALPSHFAAAQATQPTPETEGGLYERIVPSLVAVQWTWTYEYGRMDFVAAGVVVRDDGLIAIPMQAADPGVPDVQMGDFKIIIPSREQHDEQEMEAVFQGRDERGDLAFVKPKETSGRKWTPVKFEDVPVNIGDRVSSVGMLVKSSGYRPFLSGGIVGGTLRGELPTFVVTSGRLAAVGAPVFNDRGQAIGFVNAQPRTMHLLHATGGRDAEFFNNPLAALSILQFRPRLFVPAREFLMCINDPPTPEKQLEYPWVGAALTGVDKDLAEAFGLQDQAAIEVSDIVPNSPCDKAGLKTGMKIVKFDGQPLERGDTPGDISRRLTRRVQRLKPGTVVTLTVMSEKDKPPVELKMTLEKRPVRQNELPRYWAEDLGFSVRDITFHDTYTRKQPPDLKGVLVALIRPQSPAASARLENEQIIQSVNGVPVVNREQFRTEYEKLRAAKPKDAVVFVVLTQDGQTQTIRVEPPQ